MISSFKPFGVIAIICFFAWPGVSKESSPPQNKRAKVVVLSMTSCCAQTAWPAAEFAVTDELETIDLRVEQIPLSGPLATKTLRSSLVAVANETGATVVLHLFTNAKGVYWADILTVYPGESPELQRLHFQIDDHFDSQQAAVLRIVETVWALLFQKEAVPVKTKPVVPQKEMVVDEQKLKAGIGIGFASAYSSPDVPISAGVGVDIHLTVPTYLLLELGFTWAFYTKDISHNSDTATFDTKIVRGNVYWNMLPKGRIHPALGIGAGVLLFKSAGSSSPSATIENVNEKETVAYLGAAGRLAIDFSSHVAFVLNIKGGLLVPHINIYLREQFAAKYGLPLIELHGGLAFRFF